MEFSLATSQVKFYILLVKLRLCLPFSGFLQRIFSQEIKGFCG